MAKRQQKEVYFMSVPKWAVLSKATTEQEQLAAYRECQYFVHYEVADKKAMTTVRSWLEKHSGFDKDVLALLKTVPDVWFSGFSKYCYIHSKLGYMPESYENYLKEHIPLLVRHAKVKSDDEETSKPKAPVISIQQRMKDQMSEMCAEWDQFLDDLIANNAVVKDFDPYKAMTVNPIAVKPAHAKIIKDMYEAEYNEALKIVKWQDEYIKEAYCNFKTQKIRKAYLEFFEKIRTACDTIIATQKATRKPRKPKSVSKEKLVSKLKYKINESELGLASINPVDIIDAKELWVYNTKTRKIGIYFADDMQGPLSVKGTSITGFDTIKSVQKTMRKPAEQLKGFKGNARTKYKKAFDEIKATDTKLNGRMNEHTIIMKAF